MPKKLCEDNLRRSVAELIYNKQWSPEQISGRMKLEGKGQISHNTIYRAIYAGMFETNNPHVLPAKKWLRHGGKKRRKGEKKWDAIPISHRISERPPAAGSRSEIGHWEADTLIGKKGSPCLLTMVDRHSRYLMAQVIPNKLSKPLSLTMTSMLVSVPKQYRKTVTPDRGSEFAAHADVTAATGVEFYFADPYSPWQRGTVENTNGLIREYMPKSFDISSASHQQISAMVDIINRRPRKCLNWYSPHELFSKNPSSVALGLTI